MTKFFRLAALVLIALTATATASAQSEQPAFDEYPRWIVRPQGEDFAAFWPPAAMMQHVSGSVSLDCAIAIDTTAACTIVQESPTGWGFAEAALAISQTFRFRPAYRDGAPVPGGRYRVRVPFRFEKWQHIVDEYSELLGRLPPAEIIEVPIWEEAPNYEAVTRASSLRQSQGRPSTGAALLSCALEQDRRIDCNVRREFPTGQGFGAAALALAAQFRVDANDIDFLQQHRDRSFLLPIAFGDNPLSSPVDIARNRLAVNTTPPITPDLTSQYYPAAAAPENPRGGVILQCTNQASWTCSVYYENPPGLAFGDAARHMISLLPSEAADLFVGTFGDPFYIPFVFELTPPVAE